MLRHTANYANTPSNFVIQNLESPVDPHSSIFPLLCVLKNLLCRGCPTVMSRYLQGELGEIHLRQDFDVYLPFASFNAGHWRHTIKGDEEHLFFPAQAFLEKLIPQSLGDYAFIASMMLPEAPINDIVDTPSDIFEGQRVDFYLPQAKMVIEIDGSQHESDKNQHTTDLRRDEFLNRSGITTFRISTESLRNGTYRMTMRSIRQHLDNYPNLRTEYLEVARRIDRHELTNDEIRSKLLPTAIIRFQILVLEMMARGKLTMGKTWQFRILSHEEVGDFATLAINDLLIWLRQLYRLAHKQDLATPLVSVKYVTSFDGVASKDVHDIDFSLFKRYTDENDYNENVIFVRTDYFDRRKEKDYFRLASASPIHYHITKHDEKVLTFFLQNLFSKEAFLEGQFPIIQNILNLHDTIGLLPTGGGKSLCYQLPCLLQPSMNLVVCPIKSLMNDQKANLEALRIDRIAVLSSDKEIEEKEKTMQRFGEGKFFFILLAPERLQIPKFRGSLKIALSNFSIAYAVIDEVHCMSEWGHDFRTSYLRLTQTIEQLSGEKNSIKFVGLTATASVNVLRDIKAEFARDNVPLANEDIKALLDFSRHELQFTVVKDNGNKFKELTRLLTDNGIADGSNPNSVLVFTPYVNGSRGCYELAASLSTKFKDIRIAWYSGSVPREEQDTMGSKEFAAYKEDVQHAFKTRQIKLLCTTKAFGMGIDNDNVGLTFHHGLPSSVEELYQEAGRAGRWNKHDIKNRNRNAKCYVLYSQENPTTRKEIEKIFDRKATFKEIKELHQHLRGNMGRDIIAQLFLFQNGQHDVNVDFETIKVVLQNFYDTKTPSKPIHQLDLERLHLSEDSFEKALYRLAILGIVEDWTRDFNEFFFVTFNPIDTDKVISSIEKYVHKYQPETDVAQGIENVENNMVDTTLDKAIWYLLDWIFGYIVYNRKQSLKTLVDLCDTYSDSQTFKQKIDNYFRFDDTVFLLQHISEHPSEMFRWTHVFYERKENGLHVISQEKAESIKYSLSRFLESYNDNTALNFVSGFLRLWLNEFEDADGRSRLSGALDYVAKQGVYHQNELLDETVRLANETLNFEQRYTLGEELIRHFAEKTEWCAEALHCPALLNDQYFRLSQRLNHINTLLHEQITRI